MQREYICIPIIKTDFSIKTCLKCHEQNTLKNYRNKFLLKILLLNSVNEKSCLTRYFSKYE